MTDSGNSKKGKSVIRFGRRLWDRIPRLTRLPWGSWWVAGHDVMSAVVRRGGFQDSGDEGAFRFLLQFLQPGMVVFDLGAHHGLYSLLAAQKVTTTGRVFAFEPSPRERRRLRGHLFLNRCRNVRVEPLALGRSAGVGELFVCVGRETGCNSLRPPDIKEPTRRVTVPVTTVDDYVKRAGINRLDLAKLDVEGAELDVLTGAGDVLKNLQPLVLCELADVRTQPWNYSSAAIYDLLTAHGYQWFSITGDGHLLACPRRDRYHENLLAVPPTKLDAINACLQKMNPPCTAST